MAAKLEIEEMDLPPEMKMIQMVSGFWLSRTIYVAARLGLADLVKDGPKSVEEMAAACGAHAPSLYRVLRALASAGIFEETEPRHFATTPLAATLETDRPGSLRYSAISELGEEHYDAWTDVLHSVRTGEIAFDRRFGQSVWEFYEQNPENGEIFGRSMTALTTVVNMSVPMAYDFSGVEKIVDVGGGHGGFLATVLKSAPEARGVLFDQPSVVEQARRHLEAEGLAERCEAVGGNFFESVPEGGDLYVMKWIIHDWEDEKATTILGNIRRAMRPGGRLLLVESVVAPGNGPDLAKLVDVNMMVMTGGLERTEEEFRALLAGAGLRLTRVIPTMSLHSIIEAH